MHTTRTHRGKQDKHAGAWAAVTSGSCSCSTQKKQKSTWNNVPLLFLWHPKSWEEIYADTYREATARAGLQPAVASHTKFFSINAFLSFNQKKKKKKVKEVSLKMKIVTQKYRIPLAVTRLPMGTKVVFRRQHLEYTSKCHYHSDTHKPWRTL